MGFFISPLTKLDVCHPPYVNMIGTSASSMPDIGSGELYCHCYCSLNYCYSA